MKYVVKDKLTKLYVGKNHKEDRTSNKMEARTFNSRTEINASFDKDDKKKLELEPLYLRCKQCKNSRIYFVDKKQFAACTKQTSVVPSNAGFIICKHYDNKAKEKPDE